MEFRNHFIPDDTGSASGKASISGVTFSGNDVGVAAGGGEDYDIKSSQFVTDRWDIGVSKPSWPSDTNVSRNPFNHNKTGVSFLSSGGTLSRNSFTGNDVGFTSSGNQQPDFGAALDHNLFERNGDGIHVEDGGNGLQGNTAVRNTGWGIDAPGSTDLGGNHAFRKRQLPTMRGRRLLNAESGFARSRGPGGVDEPACKPGSVPGRLAAIPFGDHPSRRTVAGTFQRSTRRLGRAALERLRTPVPHECEPRASRPCSGLGFTEPSRSPGTLVVSYTTVSP